MHSLLPSAWRTGGRNSKRKGKVFGMKKLKRILALVCALNMLFGNLSLDSFVAVASDVPAAEEQVSYEGDQSAPAQEPVVVEAVPVPQVNDGKSDAPKQDVPQETEQKAEAPKVEIIANPMDERPAETMSVGETKSMALNTILTLKVSKAQMLYVSVDAPVDLKVEPGSSYPSENGKLGAIFSVTPGEYELTFSGDESIGSITVEVAEFGSSAKKEEKPAVEAASSDVEEQTEDQTSAADNNNEGTAQEQNETPAAAAQDATPAATVEQESVAATEDQQEVSSVEPMDEDDEEPVVTVETLSESEETQKNENDDNSPVIEEIVDEEKPSETPSENNTYNKEETPQIQDNQTEKTTSTDDVNADIQIQETVSETPASADAAPSQETAEEQTEVKETDTEDDTNDTETQENENEESNPEVNTVVEEVIEEAEIKSETVEENTETDDNAVSSESESEAAADKSDKENDAEDSDNKEEEKVTEEKAEDGKEYEVTENEEDNSGKTEETEDKKEKTEENEANKEEETEEDEENKDTDAEANEKIEGDEAAVTEGEEAEGEEAEKTEEVKAEGEVTEGEEDQVTEGEEGEQNEEETAEQEEASAEEKVYTFEGIGSQISLKDILAENEIEIEYVRESITWTPEVVTVPAQEGEENAEPAQISPISLDDDLNLTADAYFDEVKLTVMDVSGEQTFEFTLTNPEKKVIEEEEKKEETEESAEPEEVEEEGKLSCLIDELFTEETDEDGEAILTAPLSAILAKVEYTPAIGSSLLAITADEGIGYESLDFVTVGEGEEAVTFVDYAISVKKDAWFDAANLYISFGLDSENKEDIVIELRHPAPEKEVNDGILTEDDLDVDEDIDPTEWMSMLGEAPAPMPMLKMAKAPRLLSAAPQNVEEKQNSEENVEKDAEESKQENKEETVKERPSETKFVAFRFDNVNNEQPSDEDGLYHVTIDLDEDIDLLRNITLEENQTAHVSSFTFYHIPELKDEAGEFIGYGDPEDIPFDAPLENILTGFYFETNDFSPFVLKYTVDFTYVDEETGEEHTFSLKGQDEWALKDILDALGIKFENIENADLELSEVVEEKDIDKEGRNALYLDYNTESGYVLHSYAAFNDIYILTVVADEKNYIIYVRDDKNFIVTLYENGIVLPNDISIYIDFWGQTKENNYTIGEPNYTFAVDDYVPYNQIEFGVKYQNTKYKNGSVFSVGSDSILVITSNTDEENSITLIKLPKITEEAHFYDKNGSELNTAQLNGENATTGNYYLLLEMNGKYRLYSDQVLNQEGHEIQKQIIGSFTDENGQNGSFYTGTETINAKIVVANSQPQLKDAINGNNCTVFDVGTINSDFYKFIAEKTVTDGDLAIVVKFNKQDFTPSDHRVVIGFYDKQDDSTRFSSDNGGIPDSLKLNKTLYLRATITDKATGNRIGYYIHQINGTDLASINASGSYTVNLEASQLYTMIDANKNDLATTIPYDSTKMDIAFRLYECNENEQFPSNYKETEEKGTEPCSYQGDQVHKEAE